MKLAALILFVIVALPALAFATAQKAAPRLKVQDEQSGPIPNKVVNDVYESCLFHIPDRFTPDARKNYCACNAASLQGNFRLNEYTELQKPANRLPGNKTFEKYIHTSVAPCLVDLPIQQIEYIACLLDSSDDVRIGYAPGYCTCVANKMVKHARDLAEAEIMTKMAQDPGFTEPLDALWNNETYLRTKYKSRDECIY